MTHDGPHQDTCYRQAILPCPQCSAPTGQWRLHCQPDTAPPAKCTCCEMACAERASQVTLATGRVNVYHEPACPWVARYQAGGAAGRVPCGVTVRHARGIPGTPEGQPRFSPGDAVVLIRGAEPAVILRQVSDDRFGRRYSLRRAGDGHTATAREIDLRPRTLKGEPAMPAYAYTIEALTGSTWPDGLREVGRAGYGEHAGTADEYARHVLDAYLDGTEDAEFPRGDPGAEPCTALRAAVWDGDLPGSLGTAALRQKRRRRPGTLRLADRKRVPRRVPDAMYLLQPK